MYSVVRRRSYSAVFVRNLNLKTRRTKTLRKPFIFMSALFALLFASSFHPSAAGGSKGPCFTSGSIIAVVLDPGTAEFDVSSSGTIPAVYCQDPVDGFEREICGQAFAVCVDGEFEVGAVDNTGINLRPSLSGPSFGRPFFYKKGSTKACFLPQVTGSDPPSYNMGLLPRGTTVWLMLDNPPTAGHCVGVRTSFQFTVGSCDFCKLRKLYNICNHSTNITGVHEFELPCEDSTFSAKGLTSIAQDDDELFKFWIAPGSGAYPAGATFPHQPSGAGSTGTCAFDFLSGGVIGPCSLFACGLGTSLAPGEGGGGSSWMELYFSFFPGGVPLAPYGKPGYEKFVQVCFSIIHLNGGG